jgi:hypothetical protein
MSSDEIVDPWSMSDRKLPAGREHFANDLFPLVGFHRVSSLSMKHGGRLNCTIQARYGVSRGILRPRALSRLAAKGPPRSPTPDPLASPILRA